MEDSRIQERNLTPVFASLEGKSPLHDLELADTLKLLGKVCGDSKLRHLVTKCRRMVLLALQKYKLIILRSDPSLFQDMLEGIRSVMLTSHGKDLTSIGHAVLAIWTLPDPLIGSLDETRLPWTSVAPPPPPPAPTPAQSLCLSRLFAQLGSSYRSQSSSPSLSNRLAAVADARQLSELCTAMSAPSAAARCPAVIACAGLLKGFLAGASSTSSGREKGSPWGPILTKLQQTLAESAHHAAPWHVQQGRLLLKEHIHMDWLPSLLPDLAPWLSREFLWAPWLEVLLNSVLKEGQAEPSSSVQQQLVVALHWSRSVALALSQCHLSGVVLLDQPSCEPVLLCLLAALLGDCIQLSGLHLAALEELRNQSGAGPGRRDVNLDHCISFANARGTLESRASGGWLGEAGALTRATCEFYNAASPQVRHWVRASFVRFSIGLAEGQRLLDRCGWPDNVNRHPRGSDRVVKVKGRLLQERVIDADLTREAVNDVDLAESGSWGHAVKEVLASGNLAVTLFFESSVRACGWQGGEGAGRAREMEREADLAAVDSLEALAAIDFCRAASPAYGSLVQWAVNRAGGREGVGNELCTRMPLYRDVAGAGGSGAPSWSQDRVQTARVHFLLRVLRPCLHRIGSQPFAQHVLPLVFLYLCHPTKSVALASHAAFASALEEGGPLSPSSHAPRDGMNHPSQSSHGQTHGIYSLSPFSHAPTHDIHPLSSSSHAPTRGMDPVSRTSHAPTHDMDAPSPSSHAPSHDMDPFSRSSHALMDDGIHGSASTSTNRQQHLEQLRQEQSGWGREGVRSRESVQCGVREGEREREREREGEGEGERERRVLEERRRGERERDEMQREVIGPSFNLRQEEGGMRERVALFYMERSLKCYPKFTPLEGLVVGTRAIWQCLPSESPVPVLSVCMLMDRASELCTRDEGVQELSASVEDRRDDVSAGRSSMRMRAPGGSLTDSKESSEDNTLLQLFALIMHAASNVNLRAVPMLLEKLGRLLHSAHCTEEELAGLLDAIYGAIASSDDYTRSAIVIPWFLNVRAYRPAGQALSK